jgi:hypothetical protein
MLHGNFDEFLFIVSGYCDRAFALRRHFPAIDIFPGHGCLLWLREAQSRVLSFSEIISIRLSVDSAPPLRQIFLRTLSVVTSISFVMNSHDRIALSDLAPPP